MVRAPSDADSAIRTLDEVFIQHIKERNAQSLTDNFYAEDAELLPPNQPGVMGRYKIAEFWQRMFDAGLSKAILNTTYIDVSGDLAQARGQYAFTFSHNGKASHDKGKYLLTYRRQGDGEWKVVTDMYSSDMPVA